VCTDFGAARFSEMASLLRRREGQSEENSTKPWEGSDNVRHQNSDGGLHLSLLASPITMDPYSAAPQAAAQR